MALHVVLTLLPTYGVQGQIGPLDAMTLNSRTVIAYLTFGSSPTRHANVNSQMSAAIEILTDMSAATDAQNHPSTANNPTNGAIENLTGKTHVNDVPNHPWTVNNRMSAVIENLTGTSPKSDDRNRPRSEAIVNNLMRDVIENLIGTNLLGNGS